MNRATVVTALLLVSMPASAADPWLLSARRYVQADQEIVAGGGGAGSDPLAVRESAAAALREEGARPTPGQIEEALRSSDETKREAAAAALMLLRVESPPLVELALERVSARTFRERYYCMRYLGRSGPAQLRPHRARIVQLFQRAGPGDEVTTNGIGMLAGLDLKDSIPVYADLLAADHKEFRAWVYMHVRESGPDAVSLLVRELERRQAHGPLRFIRKYEAGLKAR